MGAAVRLRMDFNAGELSVKQLPPPRADRAGGDRRHPRRGPTEDAARPVSTATGINWFAFSAREGVPPGVVGLDNQNGRRELTGDSTAPQKAERALNGRGRTESF